MGPMIAAQSPEIVVIHVSGNDIDCQSGSPTQAVSMAVFCLAKTLIAIGVKRVIISQVIRHDSWRHFYLGVWSARTACINKFLSHQAEKVRHVSPSWDACLTKLKNMIHSPSLKRMIVTSNMEMTWHNYYFEAGKPVCMVAMHYKLRYFQINNFRNDPAPPPQGHPANKEASSPSTAMTHCQ